jgi:threonine dehydrogenase-like Zn-dependent dehydrogenase
MLIRLSQLAGLSPIVAVEPQADRRNLAKLFGADVIINPTEGGWKEKALAITGNEGFDFLIDAAGSKDVLEETLSMTARGARLLVFGVTAPDVKVNINPYEVFRKELTIIGTVINPYSFHRAVELLPNLGLENLEISQYSMSQHREAYKQLGKGGKVEITPQDQ